MYGIILMHKKSGKLYIVTSGIFYPFFMVADKNKEFAKIINYHDKDYTLIGELWDFLINTFG